jgi:hypothetical protein
MDTQARERKRETEACDEEMKDLKQNQVKSDTAVF